MPVYASPQAFSSQSRARPLLPAFNPATRQASQTQQMVSASGNPVSYQERADAARTAGYSVSGNSAVGSLGKYKTTTPLTAFGPYRPLAGTDPALIQALLEDTQAMQGAADRQFLRNQSQAGALNDWLGTIRTDVGGVADAQADALEEQAAFLRSQGNAAYQTQMAGVPETFEDVRSQMGGALRKYIPRAANELEKSSDLVDSALGQGDQAVSTAGYALSEYRDLTAEQVSAMTSGLRKQAHNTIQQLSTGVHPDGTPMTAQEQNDLLGQVRMEIGDQIQTQATAIYSHFNDTMASLRTNLSSVQHANAQLKLAGSQQRADIGTRFGELTKTAVAGSQAIAATRESQAALDAQARSSQLAFHQLGSSLSQAGAALRNAAMLQAVQLELQGQTELASLIQQNPESVVSWFQGLLSINAVNAANKGSGGGGGGLSSGKGDGKVQAPAPSPPRVGWTPGTSQGTSTPNRGATSSIPGVSMGKNGR